MVVIRMLGWKRRSQRSGGRHQRPAARGGPGWTEDPSSRQTEGAEPGEEPPRTTCSAGACTWSDVARVPGSRKLGEEQNPTRKGNRNEKAREQNHQLWECDQTRAQLYYLKTLKKKKKTKAAKDLYILFPLFFFPKKKKLKRNNV